LHAKLVTYNYVYNSHPFNCVVS